MTSLHDFFKERQQSRLSQEKKLQLYHTILDAQRSSGLLHKIASISKIVAYSVLSLTLIGGVRLSGPWSDNTSIRYDEGGFRIEQNSPITNSYRVSADSIGHVMQFQGEYTISNQGQFFETNIIYNGDKINLEEGAYMTFQVNEHLTKVIGPATLEISKTQLNGKNEYFINIVEGQFVEIEAQQPSESLTITKNNIAVHPQQETKEIKLQIIETDGKTQVKNMGDTIQVNTDSEQHKIENKQIASINTQATEIIVNDDNAVTIAIGNGSGTESQTSDISHPTRKKIAAVLDESPALPSGDETISVIQNSTQTSQANTGALQKEETRKTNTLTKKVETKKTPTSEKKISDVTQIDGKQIPNEQQVKQLQTLLQKNFLDYDIKSLIASIVYNKPNGKKITINNINNRLITLGATYNINLRNDGSMTSIQTNASRLIQHLSENYHIPPTYIHNLVALQQWTQFLEDKQLNTQPDTIDMDKLINKLYRQKPELHFK